MENLGHRSIRVTLDAYSHVVRGLQEAAAQGFDDFISAKGNSIQNVGRQGQEDHRRRRIRVGVSGFEPPTT